MGGSRSIGTTMLISTVLPERIICSRSEPMPSRSPSAPIIAAPPQLGCAGAMKIASSSRYSQ